MVVLSSPCPSIKWLFYVVMWFLLIKWSFYIGKMVVFGHSLPASHRPVHSSRSNFKREPSRPRCTSKMKASVVLGSGTCWAPWWFLFSRPLEGWNWTWRFVLCCVFFCWEMFGVSTMGWDWCWQGWVWWRGGWGCLASWRYTCYIKGSVVEHQENTIWLGKM